MTAAPATTTAVVAPPAPSGTGTGTDTGTGTGTGTGTDTTPTADASVFVANASARDGVATGYSTMLVASGWPGARPGTATDSRDVTAVLFAPGFESPARALADELGITEVGPQTTDEPIDADGAADIWLIIGRDRD